MNDAYPICALTSAASLEAPAGFTALAKGRLLAAVYRVAAWRERQRQRRALAALDDRALTDLGLDRGMVLREAGKPFWRP